MPVRLPSHHAWPSCLGEHTDTLVPWSERSPGTTATRKAIGSQNCRVVIASTSAIVHRSRSERGYWKPKGGRRGSGRRSNVRCVTEPNYQMV
jgi:hypothetical protein